MPILVVPWKVVEDVKDSTKAEVKFSTSSERGVRWGGKLASDGKKTENKDPKQGGFIDLVRRG